MRPDHDIIEAPDGLNQLRRELSEYRFDEMVDTEAHDRLVIRRINAVCGKNDDLYITGDLSAGGHKSLRRALYLLDDLNVPHSRIHLILGNHDGFHIRNTNAYDFASVCIGSISANLFLTLENGMPAIISHTPRRAYIERGVELKDVAATFEGLFEVFRWAVLKPFRAPVRTGPLRRAFAGLC